MLSVGCLQDRLVAGAAGPVWVSVKRATDSVFRRTGTWTIIRVKPKERCRDKR